MAAALNFRARQFRQGVPLEAVRETLERARLAGNFPDLELTEGLPVQAETALVQAIVTLALPLQSESDRAV